MYHLKYSNIVCNHRHRHHHCHQDNHRHLDSGSLRLHLLGIRKPLLSLRFNLSLQAGQILIIFFENDIIQFEGLTSEMRKFEM